MNKLDLEMRLIRQTAEMDELRQQMKKWASMMSVARSVGWFSREWLVEFRYAARHRDMGRLAELVEAIDGCDYRRTHPPDRIYCHCVHGQSRRRLLPGFKPDIGCDVCDTTGMLPEEGEVEDD